MSELCKVEACGLKAIVKGLCCKHYMRLRRTGKLTTSRFMGSFWSKVEKGASDACWPWKGFAKASGHGLTSIKGVPMHTSRKAWILTHGPITGGLQVLHKCDNAICCNPDHLYLGTRIDNMIDHHEQTPFSERVARGRPFMFTDVQLQRLWMMRRQGATLKECAERFGVHIATVCRYITAVRKLKLQRLRAKVAAQTANRI